MSDSPHILTGFPARDTSGPYQNSATAGAACSHFGPPSHHLDLVNGAAGFCDCGRMTIGELIEVLSELAESEDYDPASPVYLVSGNETTPRPLTDVEPDEDDDSLILIAV